MFIFAVLAVALVGPHLIGLITIPDADGYTSEFFNGENTSLQVMYSGYHDADVWLMAHSKTGGKVGIVGGSATFFWYFSVTFALTGHRRTTACVILGLLGIP